jgi:hypothetical protein
MLPIKIIKAERYTITGRGEVLAINLEDNGFGPLTGKQVKDKFMGKPIEFEGKAHIVKGIEMFAQLESTINQNIGLLLADKDYFKTINNE